MHVTTTTAGAPSATDELRALNARFIDNFITRDVDRHDAMLHPDFVAIQGDGSVLDRVTYLRQWATAFDPDLIPYWDTRGESITVIGDIGLVRSTNVFTLVQGGFSSRLATTYTDTYVREAGRWWCVQAQTTPVQLGHFAPEESIVSVYVRGVRR